LLSLTISSFMLYRQRFFGFSRKEFFNSLLDKLLDHP
jgi:hypothetical protein